MVGVGVGLRERRSDAARLVGEREDGAEPRAVDVLRAGRTRTQLRACAREGLGKSGDAVEIGDECPRAIVTEHMRSVGRGEPLPLGHLVVHDACERRDVGHDSRPEHRQDDRKLLRALDREVSARRTLESVADRRLQLRRGLGVRRADPLRPRELGELRGRDVLALAREGRVDLLERAELGGGARALHELGERERVLHLARCLARVGRGPGMAAA